MLESSMPHFDVNVTEEMHMCLREGGYLDLVDRLGHVFVCSNPTWGYLIVGGPLRDEDVTPFHRALKLVRSRL